MDGEGCVVAGPSGIRRQAYLRFPPPPPFPPDEYSYAYYAEGPSSHRHHPHRPSSSSSSSHGGSSGGSGNGSGGGLMTLGSRKGCGGGGNGGGIAGVGGGGGGRYSGGGGPGTSASLHHHHGGGGPRNPRHSYITRYGTQENLYEEIGQMRFEEEVRYVHSKHLQVLDELNLSMEAMLMPDPTPSELTTEALMSPATCSVDSGFSSSSTGTNSLGRGTAASSAAGLLINGNGGNGGGSKKKSPHGFWRKLQGLGSSSSTLASQKQSATVERRWEESSSHEQSRRSSCSDVDLSSGDESNKCLDGKSRMGSKRCICRRNSPEPGGAGCGDGAVPTPQGRLARWFSIKKQGGGGGGGGGVGSCGGQSLDNEQRGKMPLLPEEDENSLSHRRGITPSLPPPPNNLNPNQIKLRHIVDAIVQSENSYLSTLWRLVYEYKKPLEEASPAILSSAKIQSLFHRVPEILQCHKLFNIALSDAVANWDREHRIGDVFVASFSKAVVLDIYSDFINNFSMAMDLARSETKKKPALAEFFKARQNKSHDRMSFFGLMVKPVQRFPQFILFLQDLLHNTGQGHPERMALQLALTQLESLAELLNERKREAEQAQAFRQMMRSVSAKMPNAAAQHKYLIRHDDVTQLEVNSCGVISKLKNRRLLLLNDQLVCVSVNSKEENVNCQPRLTYKWSCSINDIQVIESSGSPTLSRLLTPNGSLASTNSSGTSDSLCMEMSQLMHDYQIISRIHDLTHSLKGQYVEVNAELTRSLLDGIQREIQRKDEQMAWLDSCCLEIAVKGREEPYTFQMTSQETRKEWITELRLARLALDSNNTPAWEVPEQELRPSTKMPLFVAAHPVFTASPLSEVLCGCYYSTTCGKTAYLWVCTYDGVDSHISIAQTWQTSLKPLTHFQISDTKVTSMEYVRNLDTVWLGTANDRILMYAVCDVERTEQTNCVPVAGEVTAIKVHCDNVFASLSTGRLLMFRRHGVSSDPEQIILGADPIACLLPINLSLYAACGKTITVMSAITGELQKSFTIHRDHVNGHISFLAHSGVGLWLSFSGSSTICLYHTETFKHLQDINVASNVIRVTGPPAPPSVTVTGLLAVKGLLWVGTNVGLSLTIPLPRLEGVPIISGRVHVSYHGHTGSLSLLLPLHDPPTVLKRPPSKAIASDIYGLYGQLMYVKNYDDDEKSDSEWSQSSCPDSSSPTRSNDSGGGALNSPKKEHTLITITGGSGYVNYQHCCYSAVNNVAHVVIWEMKL